MTAAKDYIRMTAVTAAALLLIPLVGYAGKRSMSTPQSAQSASASAEDTVTVLIRGTGEIVSLSERDYVIGAVFAQMPADFEEEALKAQAVLARTYAERRRLSEKGAPTPELNGAIMSDDTTLYQAYFTEEQAKALYIDDYAEAYERISAAADSTEGLTLCYEDEPVIAAFHGISFGYTESAFTMWGEDIPYLESAESLSDAESDICRRVCGFTDEEIAEKLPSLDSDDVPTLTVTEQSEHGTVLYLKAGDTRISAEDFCNALSLPSQHFAMKRTEGGWEFTVLGCGHLVGMSQYGANFLAAEGKSCEEILLHYYKDCVLVRK